MIRHKVVNSICYVYEVKEVSKGRCPEHNPPKKPLTPTAPQPARATTGSASKEGGR